MDIDAAEYRSLFIKLVSASLVGSAATAATRHDTQAAPLVRKAMEIAQAAMEELERFPAHERRKV
jgi:hypothetical protein